MRKMNGFTTRYQKTFYLWAPGGGSPSGTVKGKNQSYAITITNSSYVTIQGVDTFATTYALNSSDHCTIDGCELMYASYSKRMLGDISDEYDVTELGQVDRDS